MSARTRDLNDVRRVNIPNTQKHLLGVHLLRSQFRILSAVELKCVGFSVIRFLMMVVNKDELVSVSKAGPLNSIDNSMD